MKLLKKGLLVVAIVIATAWILFLPLALGVMAGFPFAIWADDEVKPVGASATFRESTDCLTDYRYYSPGPELGPRLDRKAAARCFPAQEAAKEHALIACFNRYQRSHPNHLGWPEDNMRGCTWDGLTATPAPFGFGDAVAVPAVPQAGEPFLVKVGVTGSDPAGEDVNAPIGDGDLEIEVTLDDKGSTTPLNFETRFGADRRIHVDFTVPRTVEGRRLIITLAIEPDRRDGVKIVEYTVGRSQT